MAKELSQWWSRNWGWVLGGLAIAVVVGFFALLFIETSGFQPDQATGRVRTIEVGRDEIIAILNKDGRIVDTNGTSTPFSYSQKKTDNPDMLFLYVTKSNKGEIHFEQYQCGDSKMPAVFEGSATNYVSYVKTQEEWMQGSKKRWVTDQDSWGADKVSSEIHLRQGIIKRIFDIDISK